MIPAWAVNTALPKADAPPIHAKRGRERGPRAAKRSDKERFISSVRFIGAVAFKRPAARANSS
jgi:hypothetical protein